MHFMKLIFVPISFIAIGCLVGLCQAGGIGGGPIISPVIMALFNVPSQKAIWNTYIVLLGGSIGNLIKVGNERTTSGEAPLINYQLAMITIPFLLGGAVIGVATGRWLPRIVVVIALFCVLIQVLYKTFCVYKNLRQKEMATEIRQVEMNTLLVRECSEEEQARKYQIGLLQLMQKEKRLFPFEYIKEIIIFVIVTILITLLKGTQNVPSLIGIHYCKFFYHLFNFILLLFAGFSVYRYWKIIKEDEELKEKNGFDFTHGKMTQAFETTVKTSFYAGFVGGVVGLGGGVILTPMWLSMGINSSRAAASSIFCVLFSSSMSVFIIALAGEYHFGEFFLFLMVAGFGSYTIASYIKRKVKELKRESILLQILLGVICFGLLILPYKSIRALQVQKSRLFEFGEFC